MRDLIQACEIVLQQNTYNGIELGQIQGVKKVDHTYFNPNVPKSTKFQKMSINFFAYIYTPFISIVFIIATIIGFYTIYQWLFQ